LFLVDNVFFYGYYKSFTLLSDKNIFKIEIHSLHFISFHFAQNDNELNMEKLLVWALLAALPPTKPTPTANTTIALSL